MTDTTEHLPAGTVVEYHGSLTEHHGVYVVDGCCICRDCDGGPVRYDLAPLHSADGKEIVGPRRRLECVGRSSVTPTGEQATRPWYLGGEYGR